MEPQACTCRRELHTDKMLSHLGHLEVIHRVQVTLHRATSISLVMQPLLQSTKDWELLVHLTPTWPANINTPQLLQFIKEVQAARQAIKLSRAHLTMVQWVLEVLVQPMLHTAQLHTKASQRDKVEHHIKVSNRVT